MDHQQKAPEIRLVAFLTARKAGRTADTTKRGEGCASSPTQQASLKSRSRNAALLSGQLMKSVSGFSFIAYFYHRPDPYEGSITAAHLVRRMCSLGI